MTNHISDELPLLLTGEAPRDVVLDAAAHLRSCVDCQQELVSAVVAHASLTSAQRFAPEIVTGSLETTIAGNERGSVEPPAPLPDLSRLFADVRAETPADVKHDAGTGRSRRRLLAVAAAAAVVAGGGITTYALVGNGSDGPASRTVALEGVTDAGDGSVRLAGSRMVVDGSGLPDLSAGQQYEVWLTDHDSRQPVGYLRDGAADINVPSTVMDKYKGIAVSVQRNGQTEFSGKVVLNGTYG